MRRSAGIIFVSVYFASLNFDLALGTGCMSLTQNEKCLSRAEVLQLGSVGESMAQYMNDGDTCFTHNRKKVT